MKKNLKKLAKALKAKLQALKPHAIGLINLTLCTIILVRQEMFYTALTDVAASLQNFALFLAMFMGNTAANMERILQIFGNNGS